MTNSPEPAADDDTPPLHPVHAERIPYDSWMPAALEMLPPSGWVNVRIWKYDEVLNRDIYVTESCPGILHMESTVTETVIQHADDDGNLFSEWGEPYDTRPVVIGTAVADPPHRHQQFVDPDWRPAYAGGGYLGSCPGELVHELLAGHGFANAIPRPTRDTEDEK